MKTLVYPNLVVMVGKPSRIRKDEFDTGEYDGTGRIEVRADSCSAITNRSFQFHNVVIEVENPDDKDDGYENWSEDELRTEAAGMLCRDYIKPKNSSMDPYFVGCE